jgi:anthranilate phosphoribosyltransferase
MRLKDGIEALMANQNLNSQVCKQMMTDLLQSDSHPFQKVAFLVLLRSKVETAEELVGMVSALQDKMVPLVPNKKTLDIVGTGGDGARTVNISTGSALLAAACGVVVAKHGNAAVTSLAGSADVLTALGVNIHMAPEKIIQSIDRLGIGFCFAPNFHPILRELRTLRQQLNVPTSFNILGPLLNPTKPAHVILGVFDPNFMPIMGQTLQKLGTEHALIVHGNGIDELSCIGPVKTLEVTPDALHMSYLDPHSLGLARCELRDLQGGSAAVNAELLRKALQGSQCRQGIAIANTLIFNAAVAIYLYGLESSIEAAIRLATEKLFDGSALTLLTQLVEFSHD